MRRTLFALTVVIAAAGLTRAVSVRAQSGDAAGGFRVFLKSGSALETNGEYARVGDSLVFTLVVGDGGPGTEYQLISLPATAVDVMRTDRYRDAVLAARYAATRGEADYKAMTADVSKALDALRTVTDPQARLRMAEQARQRVMAWPRAHYGYRAKDIEELASLFDNVIAQLRVAAGRSQFSMDLNAGPPRGPLEPLLARPSARQSVIGALWAAVATQSPTDRVALLRAADTVAESAGLADLAENARLHLEAEEITDQAYTELSSGLLREADAARHRGDVEAVEQLEAEARARDHELGARRPERMQALLAELDARLSGARANRLALDHYAMVRPSLLRYQQRIRPVLRSIDDTTPALNAIVDMRGPRMSTLERTRTSLERAGAALARVVPPDDLKDVHATLTSALRMALEACRTRRLAIATLDRAVGQNASAAAAGAEMLATEARKTLTARLEPPRIQ
jgi:hypothetical protein